MQVQETRIKTTKIKMQGNAENMNNQTIEPRTKCMNITKLKNLFQNKACTINKKDMMKKDEHAKQNNKQ